MSHFPDFYLTDSQLIATYQSDWKKISLHKYLSHSFILNHASSLDWSLVSESQNLSAELIETHASKFSLVEWMNIAKYQDLDENLISKFKNQLHDVYLKFNSRIFRRKRAELIAWNVGTIGNASEKLSYDVAREIASFLDIELGMEEKSSRYEKIEENRSLFFSELIKNYINMFAGRSLY